MPTACGIETVKDKPKISQKYSVATVPTACGIETQRNHYILPEFFQSCVATVPTACGIETTYNNLINDFDMESCNSAYRLRY